MLLKKIIILLFLNFSLITVNVSAASEEECFEKNFDETVIDMEEPNYQFEDINGVRQDCRGPEGSSGIRGPSPAIPLPYLGFN